MVGRDEMRFNRESEYWKPFFEAVLPDWRVPLRRAALQKFSAPDIVDEDVDVTVISLNLIAQAFDLVGLEMIDGDGHADASEGGHELSGLFNRFRAVVLGTR